MESREVQHECCTIQSKQDIPVYVTLQTAVVGCSFVFNYQVILFPRVLTNLCLNCL